MLPVSVGAATGLGAAGGGLLGQAADVLALPRRAAWELAGNLFGLPDEALQSGEALLGHFGADTGDPLVRALGLGLEVVGDPLTYAGGTLARAGALIPRHALQARAAALAAQRGTAQAALTRHALAGEANLAGHMGRMAELRGMVDPDALALNFGRTYKSASPEAAALAGEYRLGQALPGGGVRLEAGLKPYFDGTHAGLTPVRDAAGTVGTPAPMLTARTTGRHRLVPTAGAPAAAPPTAEELNLLRRAAVPRLREQGLPLANLHAPHAPADVFGDVGRQLAARTAPPMPAVGGLPADELFARAQGDLAAVLAQIEQLNRRSAALDPYFLMAGGGALGGAVGTPFWEGA